MPVALRTAESYEIGKALAMRVHVREKTWAQIEFLRALSRTPLREMLVLRGGAGLHGAFLHRRYTQDLDFGAPPETAQKFFALAQEHGLELVARDKTQSQLDGWAGNQNVPSLP